MKSSRSLPFMEFSCFSIFFIYSSGFFQRNRFFFISKNGSFPIWIKNIPEHSRWCVSASPVSLSPRGLSPLCSPKISGYSRNSSDRKDLCERTVSTMWCVLQPNETHPEAHAPQEAQDWTGNGHSFHSFSSVVLLSFLSLLLEGFFLNETKINPFPCSRFQSC